MIKNIEYDKIDFSKCDKIDDAALKIINNRSNLKKGDILYTSIEPIGRTYLLKENPNNWDINESVFLIRTNENIFSKEYLYLLLNNEWFRSIADTLSTGSVQKGIRISALESIIVAVPQKKILMNVRE